LIVFSRMQFRTPITRRPAWPPRGFAGLHQKSSRSANCISRGVPDPTGVIGDTLVFTVSMMLPNPVGQLVGFEVERLHVACG